MKANKSDGVAASGDKGMDVDGEAMTAEGHGRLMEMLYDAREGWHVLDAGPRSDFFVFLRGDHEKKAAGKFVECWRARAAAGDPTTFATTFNIGLTSDYHNDIWR